LVNKLVAMADRPWPEMPYSGKPITQGQLAKLLKPFKVYPKQVRFGELGFKGYMLEWFEGAWRYIPADSACAPPGSAETPKQRQKSAKFAETNGGVLPETEREKRNRMFRQKWPKTANVSVFRLFQTPTRSLPEPGSFEPDFEERQGKFAPKERTAKMFSENEEEAKRSKFHKPWSQIAEENGADAETIAWLKAREDEAPKIDPKTAEVDWSYGQVLDPYGAIGVPEDCSCVGREYFARRPGSDVWVHFDDLPDATREALWNRNRRKLAFPAGLEDLPV
jgi:uncharacterized protein DUF3631